MSVVNNFDYLNEINEKITNILNEKNIYPLGVIMLIYKILESVLKDHSKFLLINNKEPDKILKKVVGLIAIQKIMILKSLRKLSEYSICRQHLSSY